MRTYKIHLIRHGLTQANIDGAYCGSSDLSLCEAGESSLYDLLGRASYPLVEAVYVSPLARARQTADIIWPETEQTVVEGLREASFGRFEGKTLAELRGDEEFEKWIVPKSGYLPEGVEPPQEFFSRCAEALKWVIDDMMSRSIFSSGVVTHAGVIGNMLAALAYPKRPPYDWQCDAGCGFKVIADPTIYLREPVVEVVDYLPEELEDGENF